MGTILYEQDYYSWTQEQADLLQAKRFEHVDIEHLVKELQLMGARERRELLSRLRVLLMHLLKWQYQPHYIGRRSWEKTIKVQRKELGFHLEDNPSLKADIDKALNRAYDLALDDAEDETGLSRHTFPPENPWSFEQLMNVDYYPEANE